MPAWLRFSNRRCIGLHGAITAALDKRPEDNVLAEAWKRLHDILSKSAS